MNLIEQLCQRYTDLTPAEIDRICLMSSSLQSLANLEGMPMSSSTARWPTAGRTPLSWPKPSPHTCRPPIKIRWSVWWPAAKTSRPVHRTFRLGRPTKQ